VNEKVIFKIDPKERIVDLTDNDKFIFLLTERQLYKIDYLFKLIEVKIFLSH
jgi:hypothetical protein